MKKFITFFTDTIFDKDASEYRNPVVRWLVQQYKLLFYTARGLLEHGTIIRSAALTFYTLMSLVPIVALVFAVVKGFGLADGLVNNLYGTFPQSPEVIDYLIEFSEKTLARTQGGIVALVGVVMLFWAVIRVFGSIESAFNNIWEVKVTRSITRQYTDYIGVVMVVPILWIVANTVGAYAESLLGFDDTMVYAILSKLVSIFIVCIIFTFLYIVIPNTKVKFLSALTAGVVAGVIFILFQWGYIYVQQWMTSYNAIYGSFAAMPLFLIWMQISWQILLFGGELSFAYQNKDKFAEERESLLISYDSRRKVLLATMLIIVRQFREHGGAVSADFVRKHLNIPTRIVNDTLYQLVKADVLVAVRNKENDKDFSYAPARDINSLTVYNVIEAVEEHGESELNIGASPEMLLVNAELEKIKSDAGSSCDNRKLIDL